MAQGGLPESICRMSEESNEPRKTMRISRDCKYPACLAHGGGRQVGTARNGWELSDQVVKGLVLLTKGFGLYSEDSGEPVKLVKEGNDTIGSACLKDESGCHVVGWRGIGGKRDVWILLQSPQFPRL